jgi:hypothetical protein
LQPPLLLLQPLILKKKKIIIYIINKFSICLQLWKVKIYFIEPGSGDTHLYSQHSRGKDRGREISVNWRLAWSTGQVPGHPSYTEKPCFQKKKKKKKGFILQCDTQACHSLISQVITGRQRLSS